MEHPQAHQRLQVYSRSGNIPNCGFNASLRHMGNNQSMFLLNLNVFFPLSLSLSLSFFLSLCKNQFKKYPSMKIKKNCGWSKILYNLPTCHVGGEKICFLLFHYLSPFLYTFFLIFFFTFLQKISKVLLHELPHRKRWLSTGTGTPAKLSDSINSHDICIWLFLVTVIKHMILF